MARICVHGTTGISFGFLNPFARCPECGGRGEDYRLWSIREDLRIGLEHCAICLGLRQDHFLGRGRNVKHWFFGYLIGRQCWGFVPIGGRP